MMSIKYPQYRVSQWLDMGPDDADAEGMQIVYGIQRKAETGRKWAHMELDGEALIFRSQDAVAAALVSLRRTGELPKGGEHGR